jgi:plasmid maintenance system antidote protein VapI
MKITRVNIGEIVKAKVSEKKMSENKFAESIGRQRQNVKKTIFNKHSLDTDLLATISEVLDWDFFQYYKSDKECNTKDYNSSIKEIKASFTLQIGEAKKEEVFILHIGKEYVNIK